MKHTRLTREQSREQTRERLLDAACAMFITKGFVGASVEDIALAAGFTRGAFYSNFGDKAELFVELLRRDHEKMQAGLRAIFDSPASREEMEARVLAYYSRITSQNDACVLWAEAKLLATRDAGFGKRFNAFMREKHAELKAYIEEFSARVGTPLPMDPEILVLGLIALGDGVQLLPTSDPVRVPAALV
ncbi:MAG TPA: TetR/AcrR family transcriptional regulator, partial [Paraburkholderia sp.]